MVPHSTAIAYGVLSKQQLHRPKHQIAQHLTKHNPQCCQEFRCRRSLKSPNENIGNTQSWQRHRTSLGLVCIVFSPSLNSETRTPSLLALLLVSLTTSAMRASKCCRGYQDEPTNNRVLGREKSGGMLTPCQGCCCVRRAAH